MITEQAVVTACNNGRVEVRLQRTATCGHCEMAQGCGTGAIGRLLGNRSRPLVIETDQDLKPGDEVLLGLSEAALVKASLTVYGLPLVAMVGAGLLAALAGLAEIWITLFSIGGFFAGFKYASRKGRSLEAGRMTPYILEIRGNPRPLSES